MHIMNLFTLICDLFFLPRTLSSMAGQQKNIRAKKREVKRGAFEKAQMHHIPLFALQSSVMSMDG